MTGPVVTQCQGFARYAIPCKNRARVEDGFALCHHHKSQRRFTHALTAEQIKDPCSRPGRIC